MVYLDNGTNQEPTHNPSRESDQSDIPLPKNPFFHVYSLYKQCNPKPGAPPYSRCVGNGGSPSSSLVIKTLLLSHGIGSLVVIGRFLDLGITPAYRFLRRQVRWSGIPISLRILHSLCDPHKVFSIINETEVDVLGEFPCFFFCF